MSGKDANALVYFAYRIKLKDSVTLQDLIPMLSSVSFLF